MSKTLDGNEAAAWVAYRVNEICAIYPITPSSEVLHYLSEWMPKTGGTVLQTEDELAAEGITARVKARVKAPFSIFNNIERPVAPLLVDEGSGLLRRHPASVHAARARAGRRQATRRPAAVAPLEGQCRRVVRRDHEAALPVVDEGRVRADGGRLGRRRALGDGAGALRDAPPRHAPRSPLCERGARGGAFARLPQGGSGHGAAGIVTKITNEDHISFMCADSSVERPSE